MGKVLRAVAAIVVAVAVVYFAPQLSAYLVAHGVSALAAAAITAVAATAVSLAANTLLAPRPHTTAAAGFQPSRGQPVEIVGWERRYPLDPPLGIMLPKRDHWWRDGIFYPWQRYAIDRTDGDCLAPTVPAGIGWSVLDRTAPIRAGDICVFRIDDLAEYLRAGGREPKSAAGLMKRFVGIDPDRRVMVYETTNPPNRMESGLNRLEYAYHVVSWHRSWWTAWRAMWKARWRI